MIITETILTISSLIIFFVALFECWCVDIASVLTRILSNFHCRSRYTKSALCFEFSKYSACFLKKGEFCQDRQFTASDPIRYGLNWYAYANNNPLRFVDPTGLVIIDGGLEGINWGFFTTGDYSRTGGVDLNLGIFSMSAGKNGFQVEISNIINSYSMAITTGGPEVERGVNFNYSNIFLTDINVGFQGGSLYANAESLGFGIEAYLGQTTGIGVYAPFGQAYAGTDAIIVYNTLTGGTYDNDKDDPKSIGAGFWRLGGKYVGPNWTANGWSSTKYFYDDWENWPIAYSIFDHSARQHDKISNWNTGDDADINEADRQLVYNSIKSFFFSSHASDRVRAFIGIFYFSIIGSNFDYQW